MIVTPKLLVTTEGVTQGRRLLTVTLHTMTGSGESPGLHRGQRGTVATTTATGSTGRSVGEALGLAAVQPAGDQGADQGVERCHQLGVTVWAREGVGMTQGGGDGCVQWTVEDGYVYGSGYT